MALVAATFGIACTLSVSMHASAQLTSTDPAAGDHHKGSTSPTPTPTPKPTPTPLTSGGGTATTSEPTATATTTAPTPKPKPTTAPKPTPVPSTPKPAPDKTPKGTPAPGGKASGGSSSPHGSGGGNGQPSSGSGGASLPLDLDGTHIPPVVALTPLSGLDFGNGLAVGPLLALLDALGVAGVCYLVRKNWLTSAE